MRNSFRSIGLLFVLTLLAACSPKTFGAAAGKTDSPPPLRAFVLPRDSYNPVLEIIESAKKDLRMEMFLLNDREVIQALKDAQHRGVNVRVILDPAPAGVGTGNRPGTAELQANGIRVQPGDSLYPVTHTRAVTADDRVALIMTFDQSKSSFVYNRDYGIIDSTADDVTEINAVFDAHWNRTTVEMKNPNLVWGPQDSRRRITALIDSAAKTLDLQCGVMQDDQVVARLAAAVQRGVAVRLIMSPSTNGPDANSAARETLQQAGVRVRMLKTPVIHGTMFVVDNRQAFLGSQEFSPLSLDSSRELGILLQDKTVVGGLAGTFLNDWEVAR